MVVARKRKRKRAREVVKSDMADKGLRSEVRSMSKRPAMQAKEV